MPNASCVTKYKTNETNTLVQHVPAHLRHDTYAEQYVTIVIMSIPAKAFRLLDAACAQLHPRIIMDAAVQHGMPTPYGK